MPLVNWSPNKRAARGRSGTHYRLVAAEASAATSCRWLIEVDDNVLCSTDAVREAVDQVERIEALRCVLAGLAGEMTALQLSQARAVAAEMQEAAQRSLLDRRLRAEDVEQVRRNIVELRGLIGFLDRERTGRYVADEPARVLH